MSAYVVFPASFFPYTTTIGASGRSKGASERYLPKSLGVMFVIFIPTHPRLLLVSQKEMHSEFVGVID